MLTRSHAILLTLHQCKLLFHCSCLNWSQFYQKRCVHRERMLCKHASSSLSMLRVPCFQSMPFKQIVEPDRVDLMIQSTAVQSTRLDWYTASMLLSIYLASLASSSAISRFNSLTVCSAACNSVLSACNCSPLVVHATLPLAIATLLSKAPSCALTVLEPLAPSCNNASCRCCWCLIAVAAALLALLSATLSAKGLTSWLPSKASLQVLQAHRDAAFSISLAFAELAKALGPNVALPLAICCK